MAGRTNGWNNTHGPTRVISVVPLCLRRLTITEGLLLAEDQTDSPES